MNVSSEPPLFEPALLSKPTLSNARSKALTECNVFAKLHRWVSKSLLGIIMTKHDSDNGTVSKFRVVRVCIGELYIKVSYWSDDSIGR